MLLLTPSFKKQEAGRILDLFFLRRLPYESVPYECNAGFAKSLLLKHEATKLDQNL